VDNQAEVREFLRTRRARLTPAQSGIIGGGRRRVSGLRREEVAMLAAVSADYYAKMERGNLAGVSPEVLDSVARALQLDDAETEHLHDLAHAAAPALIRRRARTAEGTLRP
jgi:transcriptional regulator with XRE-family HTH domain